MYVFSANYYVMRVSFIDMSSSQVKRFMKIVKNCDELFLNKNKKWILYYIKLRIEATTLGEENCYINIAGGTKEGATRSRQRASGSRSGISKSSITFPWARC